MRCRPLPTCAASTSLARLNALGTALRRDMRKGNAQGSITFIDRPVVEPSFRTATLSIQRARAGERRQAVTPGEPGHNTVLVHSATPDTTWLASSHPAPPAPSPSPHTEDY